MVKESPSRNRSAEVMASVDDDGNSERLVMADLTVDNAWLSISIGDAVPLSSCR